MHSGSRRLDRSTHRSYRATRGAAKVDFATRARVSYLLSGAFKPLRRDREEYTRMDIDELLARESIRDLVARYNACGDAGRFDEMIALFAEDAVVELRGETLEGRATIRGMFERVASRTGKKPKAPDALPRASKSRAKFIRHYTSTHQIDVEGPDRARGRAYYAVLTDAGLDHWGRYVDDYVRDGGRWLFARRRISVDATVPGGWADGDG